MCWNQPSVGDDHDRTLPGPIASQARGDLRRHGTSRIVPTTLNLHRILAVEAEIRG
jgi:hypothetical protein